MPLRPLFETLRQDRLADWQRYALAIAACCLTALMAAPLHNVLDAANIVMLFLLTVLLVAVGLGRGAAVLAAFFSVILFDFFFVPPRFSMAVADAQYLVTFAVMLATALVTAHLAAGLRHQAKLAATRERHTRALYEMARDLGGALTVDQVTGITRNFLRRELASDCRLLLPNADGHLESSPGSEPAALLVLENSLATMAFTAGRVVPCEQIVDGASPIAYFPLPAPTRIRGVMAIARLDPASGGLDAQQPLLETLASLVAIAVERLHYVAVAQASQLEMAAERLRSSILSALSHDLRTPLTALVGLADSLALIKPPLPAQALDTAEALHEQADRLANLVGNLLDMARLQAGQVTLRREWQPLEEVIGASIKLLGPGLAAHPVRVSLPATLPLLEFDAVLMERVFCNLLENAAKYAPAGTTIEIVAAPEGRQVRIAVRDQGPGFPKGTADRVFAMFVRGDPGSTKAGVGLGLAICRAIVEAHGGKIQVGDRSDGGEIQFTLPTGTPPSIEVEPLTPGGHQS